MTLTKIKVIFFLGLFTFFNSALGKRPDPNLPKVKITLPAAQFLAFELDRFFEEKYNTSASSLYIDYLAPNTITISYEHQKGTENEIETYTRVFRANLKIRCIEHIIDCDKILIKNLNESK